MEHAQRDYGKNGSFFKSRNCVLILILMEHAQRGSPFWLLHEEGQGLNPYFNGTCSKSFYENKILSSYLDSLNPYFNGTCSKRQRDIANGVLFKES